MLGWLLPFLNEKRALRGALRDVAAILAGTDQRWWAGVLLAVERRVPQEPREAARAVLRLYEGARAPAGTVEGAYALDTVVVTRGGKAYTADNPTLWRESLRYAALLSTLYEAALRVWFHSDPARKDPPAERTPTYLMVDYGGGSQIWWKRGGTYLLRYDCGSHVSRWREDVITEEEMEQGLLGPAHFHRMVVQVQNRLERAGVDPYAGSSGPLPDPE